MTPLEIPEKYEDVTAEWLTAALREGGVISDATVSGFEIEPLGADRSRASSLARFELTYDGPSDNLPSSLFAKFVSRIPENRAVIAEFDPFHREIEFYRNLGTEIPLDIPRYYYGAESSDSDLAVLLLEEIDAIPNLEDVPLAESGLTEREATLALTQIAKMHAAWWKSPRLSEYSWLGFVEGAGRKRLYREYPGAWVNLRPVIQSTLTPEAMDICDRLERFLPTLLSELGRMPETLCHGDYHIQNVLWDRPGDPTRIWILDWQAPVRGPAVLDVANFLSIGLNGRDIGMLRDSLLPSYHAALSSHGVKSYSYEQLLDHYRLGLLDTLTRMTSFFALFDFASDDIAELQRGIMGRVTAAAEEMDCAELLQ